MVYDKQTFKQDKKAFKNDKKAAKKQVKESWKNSNYGFSGVGDISSDENRTFVDGVTNMNGGEFKELFVEGVCNFFDSINAEKLGVEGVFSCKGDITSKIFYCEGVATITGNVRANEVSVEGVVEIRGSLEADKISCEGVIRTEGEISADLVMARGAIFAREIVGEKIVIKSEVKGFMARKFINKRDVADLIEATTIELHRVNAKVVNGHDIRIGYKCNIDSIDCSGTLYLDPTAKVGEIKGNYQRIEE